jgi:hypothetical protein
MNLDALLAGFDARDDTPVTAAVLPDVTLEPLLMLERTSVTPVTAESVLLQFSAIERSQNYEHRR